MSVFSNPSYDGHERVVFGNDAETGLKAIIAIHNTALGPAVGGCRMWSHENDAAALEDALRLARGMTYKSALAGLPFGGFGANGNDPRVGMGAAHERGMEHSR